MQTYAIQSQPICNILRFSFLFSQLNLEPIWFLQLFGILFPFPGSHCWSLALRAVARPRCCAKWRVCTTRSFSIAWSSWTPLVRSLGDWDGEAGYGEPMMCRQDVKNYNTYTIWNKSGSCFIINHVEGDLEMAGLCFWLNYIVHVEKHLFGVR